MNTNGNIHAVARITKLTESRDELTSQLAGRIVKDAAAMYDTVGTAAEKPRLVLAAALYAVVEREVAAAVAVAKADAERDYRAKLEGFRAAILRATDQWR
jgi:hypothetical protein